MLHIIIIPMKSILPLSGAFLPFRLVTKPQQSLSEGALGKHSSCKHHGLPPPLLPPPSPPSPPQVHCMHQPKCSRGPVEGALFYMVQGMEI